MGIIESDCMVNFSIELDIVEELFDIIKFSFTWSSFIFELNTDSTF